MAVSALYIGCDMDVGYTGARASLAGSYLNSGTCTYSLADAAGTVVGTGTLAYESASNGNYYGTIESTVTDDLVENEFYTLTITFVQSGYNDERVFSLPAIYRQAS